MGNDASRPRRAGLHGISPQTERDGFGCRLIGSPRWIGKAAGRRPFFLVRDLPFGQFCVLANAPIGRALWDVLSRQATGALIRPALPQALWIAKRYGDSGR